MTGGRLIALRESLTAVEDGDYRPQPEIGFSEWADRWLDSLERKPSTVGSYRSTIAHAKEAFGGKRVRRIGPEDIARFNDDLARSRLFRVHSREALARVGRVSQAAVFYRYAELESGSGAAAGTEAPSGAQGGRLLRE